METDWLTAGGIGAFGVEESVRFSARRARPSNGSSLKARIESMREVCHDLRGSAATIDAIAVAAGVEADLSPLMQARLGQISAEARRILEVCREGLGDARWREAVDLEAVVTEVIDAARLTTTTEVTLVSSGARVLGDRTALSRAVANLVENALRAAGPDGSVAVRIDSFDGHVTVGIADSGSGLEPEGERLTAGLGLRIASRIANEHGGALVLGRSPQLGGAAVAMVLATESASRTIPVAR